MLDTRNGTGTGGAVGAVGAGETIDVKVTGVGGVPATGVTGVAMNVTVDQPTGSRLPHRLADGRAAAARVDAQLRARADGRQPRARQGRRRRASVSIYNSWGDTHVVADVVGYFSANGGAFVPVAPQRLVDTRDGRGGRLGQLGQAETFAVTLANGSPVPPSAKGVIVNVTAADSSIPSFVTTWPTGVARPNASTMNPRPGVPVPNQAYLKLGPGGSLDVYNNSGSTDIIVDIFGYTV